jgi:hypothetical protein
VRDNTRGRRTIFPVFEGSQAVAASPSGGGNICERDYFYDPGRVAL